MPLYLSPFNNQPVFRWDLAKLSPALGAIRHRLGRLAGMLELLGPSIRSVLRDAEPDRDLLLTEEQLLEWHGGPWRHTDLASAHRVHRSSPDIPVLRAEIRKFLNWFNTKSVIDPVLKAAIAHLWFLVIQPFDKGNEAIAERITDRLLCLADGAAERYYDLPAEIRAAGGKHDELVNDARRGVLEITAWVEWFLDRLDRALFRTEQEIAGLVRKARLMDRFSGLPFNDRQQLIINKLLEAAGRISSSQWASQAGCSQDTALRDIQELIDRSILMKEPAGGRSTNYILREALV
jgi:Fic family protein